MIFNEELDRMQNITYKAPELAHLYMKVAINSGQVGLWQYNLQTNELIWDDTMFALYGCSRKDFSGTYNEWSERLHPDDRAVTETALKDAVYGKTNYSPDFRVIWANGEIHHLTGHVQVVSDKAGTPLYLVGTNWDNSLLIHTHEQLLLARIPINKREQIDKEHLDQLALVTRLGLMGEMVSGLAHEVNNPLAAIIYYAQLSLNLIKKENPDLIKLSEVAAKTQEQALRAVKIICQMKDSCKSTSLQRSATNINELINKSVSLCADQLKQNSITITLRLNDNLPLIEVDHMQIEQVLINLIRNGIEAIIGIPEKKQGEISIQSYLTLNHEIQVRVKDNGSGIQEDQKLEILMPFYTTKSDGVGMGLSISRSMIEDHKGKLTFNSQYGKGSTFYFTLPV